MSFSTDEESVAYGGGGGGGEGSRPRRQEVLGQN